MQNIQTALVFFMLVNGVPDGNTQLIETVSNNCKQEMLVIDGINKAQRDKGISLVAWCQTGELSK